jgi:hypothetical protein
VATFIVNYEAVVGAKELELLARLVGKPLDSVSADHWSATIHTPALSLLIIPEEVPTPTASHSSADVDRPGVEVTHAGGDGELVGRDLGTVHEITLLRALVTFSDVVEVPPTEILKELGAVTSRAYGVVFLDPSADTDVSSGNGAPVVVADIGIELATDRHRTITFFTRAVGHFVEVVLDAGLPRDLLPHIRRHRLSVGGRG